MHIADASAGNVTAAVNEKSRHSELVHEQILVNHLTRLICCAKPLLSASFEVDIQRTVAGGVPNSRSVMSLSTTVIGIRVEEGRVPDFDGVISWRYKGSRSDGVMYVTD